MCVFLFTSNTSRILVFQQASLWAHFSTQLSCRASCCMPIALCHFCRHVKTVVETHTHTHRCESWKGWDMCDYPDTLFTLDLAARSRPVIAVECSHCGLMHMQHPALCENCSFFSPLTLMRVEFIVMRFNY